MTQPERVGTVVLAVQNAHSQARCFAALSMTPYAKHVLRQADGGQAVGLSRTGAACNVLVEVLSDNGGGSEGLLYVTAGDGHGNLDTLDLRLRIFDEGLS